MVCLLPFSRECNRPIIRVRNPDNRVQKPGEASGFTSSPPRLCNIEYYEEQNKTNKITSKEMQGSTTAMIFSPKTQARFVRHKEKILSDVACHFYKCAASRQRHRHKQNQPRQGEPREIGSPNIFQT